jgi:hypothetical protein
MCRVSALTLEKPDGKATTSGRYKYLVGTINITVSIVKMILGTDLLHDRITRLTYKAHSDDGYTGSLINLARSQLLTMWTNR